ncbi:MAG: Dabb family protein [Caldimonas sp.]
MTVHHMVLLEFDDKLSDAGVGQMFGAIDRLLKQIPGVMDVQWGRNFASRASNVTHAAIVTLKDRQSLAGYGPHPNHVEVQQILKPRLKSLSVVDIET